LRDLNQQRIISDYLARLPEIRQRQEAERRERLRLDIAAADRKPMFSDAEYLRTSRETADLVEAAVYEALGNQSDDSDSDDEDDDEEFISSTETEESHGNDDGDKGNAILSAEKDAHESSVDDGSSSEGSGTADESDDGEDSDSDRRGKKRMSSAVR
jgi:hypothetical protein